MSGTSADGVDVALVRITGSGPNLRLRFVAHQHFPYPTPVRRGVLDAMNSSSARVADLARLNVLLGELYADAVQRTLKQHPVALQLVGCHGQTLYHQDHSSRFLGRRIATTWQTGESSQLAVRLGVPVVSDFRPADMAVGGTGAPLVPLLDIAFYGHRKTLHVLQNLGGIGNLTIIPPGSHLGRMDRVIAFDTGPGNMVIDGLAQKLLSTDFDKNGTAASKGKVLEKALTRALRHPFFKRMPPKSAGREQFGREFSERFLRWCGRRARKTDVLATATALTAVSIGKSLREGLAQLKITIPIVPSGEYIVSGGGGKNRTLMRMISAEVEPLGFRVLSSDRFGMPSQAKEAAAFALLAYQTWHRKPGNVPSATGASRAAVLGKVSYP